MMNAKLNDEQFDAMCCTDGPLLILAGAGSGKTRVITHRIAYLIEEKGVNPYHILAITFTNKAAEEMRERVDRIVTQGAEYVWVSTFHSLCVRILRRHIDLLGYDTRFTIYDSDDQKSVIKNVAKRLNLDSKQYPERMLMNAISKAKEQFITPDEYERTASGNYKLMQIGRVYQEYQRTLRSNNALDFDDLLFKTVELFQFNPDVLEYYQDRFQYIMVDEYQDTNHIQFILVKQLARKYKNLCVVGDDDQSIYKFRGANIYNILNFEEEYKEATVVKLEQNYRSTGNILNAANSVIANNKGRKDKSLWTDQEEGELISYTQYDNEYMEAEGVVREIGKCHDVLGRSYNDFAILYRTNAQSRNFEEKLLMMNIPYRIVGGQNFYGRKEIKDLISYLKVIENGVDDLAVRRIINIPKRGIGATTVDKVIAYADANEISMLDALYQASDIPGLGKAATKIEGFTSLIRSFRVLVDQGELLSRIFQEILDQTGYYAELVNEGTPESEARIENIEELRNKIIHFEEEHDGEDTSLGALLEEIALVAEIDNLDESEDKVVLMTLHSAKGLEFPYVFIGGMEERLFPSGMSINSENPEEEIEEERRLCYVGITRAQERLYLSSARMRMLNGQTSINPISRFVKEIPEELLNKKIGGYGNDNRPKKNTFSFGGGYSNNYDGYSGTSSSYGTPSFGRSIDELSQRNYAKKSPYKATTSSGPKITTIDYGVGDRVSHVKFGLGTVTNLEAGGNDYTVTVEFDKVGVKKMFASFANLKKQ